MTVEKTPLRIAQDAAKPAGPYLGSPDSGVIGRRCCRCSGDMSNGGIRFDGDDRHQAGGYCVCCAEIVAFWPCIDGEDHE